MPSDLVPRIDHLTTQRLFGLDVVADASVDELVDLLSDEAADPSPGWRCVVTPNVDHLVRYDRHPHEHEVARRSFVVLPDGMPVVWSSRLLGRPVKRRLAGSDLFSALWPRLGRDRVPAVVVASSSAVLDGLTAEHPGAQGFVAPFFDVDDEPAVQRVVDDVEAACAASGARLVFVLVSMPKHHLVADRLARRWTDPDEVHPIVLLLGASAEFHLGLTARAPRWMQRWGLEWLHRLVADPRRMARRYLVEDPRFATLVWREWRARRDTGSA